MAGCADKLKILSDTTRLDILRRLMDGPLHVNELNAKVRIDQSLLSHHLRILRENGFVRCKRDGKAVLYSLAPEVVVRAPKKGIDLGCCVVAFEDVFFKGES